MMMMMQGDDWESLSLSRRLVVRGFLLWETSRRCSRLAKDWAFHLVRVLTKICMPSLRCSSR
jgi:hypothetical protein